MHGFKIITVESQFLIFSNRSDNSFIRRENCERFCFYCDSSAFVQYMLSGTV